MNFSSRSILFLIIYGLLCIHPLFSASKTYSDTITSEEYSLETETPVHSLFGGAGYGNNMIYLGSTISQNQPYLYAALTYGFKDSFYVSASSVHLPEMSPFLAFNTATISYNHVFNTWFDIAAAISYYNVAPSLTDSLFNSFIYGNITAGFDWRILYTKISAGGLFSEDNSAFIQIRNSRYFQTPDFSSKKLYFSFDPYINVICGSLTTALTVGGSTLKLSPPYRNGGKTGNLPAGTRLETKFSFLEADFGLPVALNSDRFILEAEAGYVIPLYKDADADGLKGFLFTLSFYFRIF